MAGDAKVIEVSPGELILDHDGQRKRFFVAVNGDLRWIFCEGQVYQIEVAETAAPPTPGATMPTATRRPRTAMPGALSAPMPATVLRIQTTRGAVVKKGDTLLVLEAMKMELPLRSPQDGTIEAVHCSEGQLVQPGIILVEFRGD
jgi:biotin carboxyl carrier protein